MIKLDVVAMVRRRLKRGDKTTSLKALEQS